MLIKMKLNNANRRLVFFILLLILTIPLFFLLTSCATYNLKDIKKPENVDKKILEEFDKNIKEQNFFASCKSYIEYKNCCETDNKLSLMESKIKELYKKKEVEFNKDSLYGVDYSFTMYSLFDDKNDIENYKNILIDGINRAIDKNIYKMHSLEAASFLIYMSRYLPDYYYPYYKLVEVFLNRKNQLLSEKYLKKVKELISKKDYKYKVDKDIFNKLEDLENKIEKLKKDDKKVNNPLQTAIANTIDSSVKIIVDKGIKTEGGATVPDKILGTGVVIDKEGYILTNYHIIKSSVDPEYEGYSKIYVIPGKDESIKLVANVVGYDRVFDLALIKVEKRLESKIKIGDSDKLKEGEQVLAIGNPIGLVNTVTSGIVSATKRPFIQIGNIIQIDTALNPGNSGGALINKNGYLVGIAFAGFLELENLNFAIPSNLVLYDLFKLFKKGEVKRSWIGASAEKTGNDIVINYIVPNSSAELGGLKINDIIENVNSVSTKEIFDVQNSISYFEKPVIVRLHIKRDGEEHILKLPLSDRPFLPSLYIYFHDSVESIVAPLFGIVLTDVSPGRRRYIPVKRVIPGTPAAEFGITRGDEIKIRGIVYRKKTGVFFLQADLKSKRFGYMGKSIVLVNYEEINSFL